MAAKKVSWDIAELEFQYSSIRNYLTTIREELGNEESLRETVASSFQTPAGEMYRQHLSGNIQTLTQIADEVDSLMRDLRKVISNYQACEEDVGAKVGELISSLQ